MEIFLQSETWVALFTLTFLEIVLGIDNIIFVSIVSNKLPPEKQGSTRTVGLLMALVFRIGLLLSISYITRLVHPIATIESFGLLGFVIPEYHLTGRSLILALGGFFLLAKSTSEIHHKMEGQEEGGKKNGKKISVAAVLFQIILLDMVFSFDSILTAIGLAKDVLIMIIAVIISVIIMIAFAGPISRFINKHPSLQILALSFLILIGFMLILESLEVEIPKGYIYFAIFFSLIVELINMRLRRKSKNKTPPAEK